MMGAACNEDGRIEKGRSQWKNKQRIHEKAWYAYSGKLTIRAGDSKFHALFLNTGDTYDEEEQAG